VGRWQRRVAAAVQNEVAGKALFVLVTADHLFGEGGLDGLLAAGEPAVLIDPAPDRPAWAEGTRVRVVEGAVVAFGKHLEEPAIDCGAFLLAPEVFGRQHQAAAEGDHTLAGAVTRLVQARPLRAVALPAGCWWQDVDTPQDARAARMALRRSLVKEADGPVSRWLNRPLSTRLSMVLARLRPAPDLVRWGRSGWAWPGRSCWRPAGAWPAGCWSTRARSPTGSMGRWLGSSCGVGRGGRWWMGWWTGWGMGPSWLGLGYGHWTATTPRGCWC
jgi:hypothetical protein